MDNFPNPPHIVFSSMGFMNFSAVKPRAVSVTDNLCNKQGNLSLKSVVYNGERFQIKIYKFSLGVPSPSPLKRPRLWMGAISL